MARYEVRRRWWPLALAFGVAPSPRCAGMGWKMGSIPLRQAMGVAAGAGGAPLVAWPQAVEEVAIA